MAFDSQKKWLSIAQGGGERLRISISISPAAVAVDNQSRRR
jgi:hypothetical protein